MEQDEHGMFYSSRRPETVKGNIAILYIIFESADDEGTPLLHYERHAVSHPKGGERTRLQWRKYLEKSITKELSRAKVFLNKRTDKKWTVRAFVGWQLQHQVGILNAKRVWTAMRDDGGIELKDGGVLYHSSDSITVINQDATRESYTSIEAMRKARNIEGK